MAILILVVLISSLFSISGLVVYHKRMKALEREIGNLNKAMQSMPDLLAAKIDSPITHRIDALIEASKSYDERKWKNMREAFKVPNERS
jgi:CHAD domain-containing protein